jgi:putative CocE/NonD family hydrolase
MNAMSHIARLLMLVCLVLGTLPCVVSAEDDEELEKLQRTLEAIASVDQKVMVPMRDGVRLATDIYRPKGVEADLPTIFVRTPYNFNKPEKYTLTIVTGFVSKGYAVVVQNERGKYFSEGEWEILGFPRTDGYDALTWIAEQPWSNGKVGTIGCSSSAEWQMALAATDHPAHAAMVPMAAGAGIGRVGGFYEQGNWYRGGVFQILFLSWLYGVQNTQRPTLPADLSQEDLVRLSKYFDLAPDMPEIEGSTAIRHLPLVAIMESVDGPKGTYAEFIQRFPDDPAWYEGGLYHDDEPWGVPSLWFNSWYDISVGPNLALSNHVTHNADDPEVANNQFVVIAPVTHCGFMRTEEKTVVGERDLGDARLDYMGLTVKWFDYWLKGEDNEFVDDTPKVQYYTMGRNEWQSAPTWPPPGVELVTYYLDSGGKANSLFGDGVLSTKMPAAETTADTFRYDPTVPVPSVGGGVCCIGDAIEAGSFDQREIEARNDVLVFTSEPLEEALEVTGTIEVTLYVSSDARDTDFTVKLLDVYPDGRAYNLDETIQRARYREGYDRQVFMEPGQVYELAVSPMSTSNTFAAGHRIRIEVSSSNFPRFARNLNTGGRNYDEVEGVVATNTVHHSPAHPSQIRLPVVSGR